MDQNSIVSIPDLLIDINLLISCTTDDIHRGLKTTGSNYNLIRLMDLYYGKIPCNRCRN